MKTLKKIMAMLLVGIVTFITPVNVFAMPNADDGITTFAYWQSDETSMNFTKYVKSSGVYEGNFVVKGTIKLSYQWDEGYDSEFKSGSGYAWVAEIPGNLRDEDWNAEVRHMKTTGRTILFKVVLVKDGMDMGSGEISFYVDEYGQVFMN